MQENQQQKKHAPHSLEQQALLIETARERKLGNRKEVKTEEKGLSLFTPKFPLQRHKEMTKIGMVSIEKHHC